MTTNSAFGWPILSRSDSASRTTQSALEGAAFNASVRTDRAGYIAIQREAQRISVEVLA